MKVISAGELWGLNITKFRDGKQCMQLKMKHLVYTF